MSALQSIGSVATQSFDHTDSQELTIGEMAREFGVSLRTLRFYEDRGMLQPRREGTSRYYGDLDRLRLQLILKGKQLGFTLSEIRDLIGPGDSASHSEFGHLERQGAEIESAIARLRATHARLAGASAERSPRQSLV
jgi:DNA-binding transcriptional MerR regulator